MEADCSIFLCRTPHALGPEWVWGRKLCAEFLSEGNRNIPLRIVEHAPPFSVRDVLVSESALIGVVLDDGLLWGPLGWETLRQKLVQIPSLAVIGPVSNEATVREQQCAPPFPYQTPSALRLACLAQCQLYHNQWQETFALDPFAFLVRRSSLLTLDPELSLTQVPSSLALQGGVLGVTLDTYVHRYPAMHELSRLDLQERIPRDAACILDVGCAAGAFGATIKARQDCLVVGIEYNSLLTETAKTRLDQVVRGDVEELALTTFPAEFDCIVCGDVLEHLRDPWAVVTKLTAWLKPGGLLVATLPNVGHWSIVYDLLRGRWDVIPFGLLCWSHFRFFTRVGVEHLFAGSQLTIETLEGIAEALSPAGEAFLQQAVMLMADSDQESLRTVEFVVTARKRTQAG